MIAPKLTMQEEQTINLILEGFSGRAKRPLTLEQLIAEWEQFVSTLKKCYPFSIYDYQNDLSIRDLLQEILEQSPSSIREKIIRTVSPLDEQFKQLTYKINSPLLDGINPRYWWWYRFPKNAGNELRDTVESLEKGIFGYLGSSG